MKCDYCGRMEPPTGPFLRLVRLGDGRWICWDCRDPAMRDPDTGERRQVDNSEA